MYLRIRESTEERRKLCFAVLHFFLLGTVKMKMKNDENEMGVTSRHRGRRGVPSGANESL